MIIGKKGFSLIEVLIAMAILSLALGYSLNLSKSSSQNASTVKNNSTAIKIMDELNRDISLGNWISSGLGSFSMAYDSDGINVAPGPNAVFLVSVDVHVYAQMDSLKEITCKIMWNQNGKTKAIDFRVLK